MRFIRFAILVGLLLGETCDSFAKARDPIRNFLEGYTVKDGKTVSGYVDGGTFVKGMGLENPGLIALMSFAYSALSVVQQRELASSAHFEALLEKWHFSETETTSLENLLRKKFTLQAEEQDQRARLPLANLSGPEKKLREQRLLTERLGPGEWKALEGLYSVKKLSEVDRHTLEQAFHAHKRSQTQLWLAWQLMQELITRSLREFDLRGYRAVASLAAEANLSDDKKATADLALKRYVIDRAGELYLGALKFLSLRQKPLTDLADEDPDAAARAPGAGLEPGDLSAAEKGTDDLFSWLDWETFSPGKPEAGRDFLVADRHAVPVYANQELMPSAKLIADGFKQILNKQAVDSPIAKLDLSNPDPKVKRELARMILGERLLDRLPASPMRKAEGLVTFYLHCIGALVDAFNVNTHDSFELMRTAFFVSFRHVLDQDAHENWPKDFSSLYRAADYRPLPRLLPHFRPLKETLEKVQQIRREIYLAETKAGPALIHDDEKQRAREFDILHGDLIKEIFGTDYRAYVWPTQGTPADDRRLENSIPRQKWRHDAEGKLIPEVRLEDGSPLPEVAHAQSGDVWLELGTGLGSLLISLGTQSTSPKDSVKDFLNQPSLWDVAREKLYSRWAAALDWAGSENVDFKLPDLPLSLKLDRPGAGIDYKGFSHAGLIEKYSDPNYPEMDRADFIDAFPNRMRQAWRAHGWGATHARKAGLFRLREEVATAHAENFNAIRDQVEQQMKSAWENVPDSLKQMWGQHTDQNHFGSFDFCRKYLSRLQFKSYDNPQKFFMQRETARPVYDYCRLVFKKRGLDRFESEILKKGGAQWPASRLVSAMGELVVTVARGIRNQWPEYEGLGTSFDNRYDYLTKSEMYCVEFVDQTWLLATGLSVWNEAKFKRPVRELLKAIPEEKLKEYSHGFWKMPYGEEDLMYAPQDIVASEFGRSHWRALIISNFAFFGVSDE